MMAPATKPKTILVVSGSEAVWKMPAKDILPSHIPVFPVDYAPSPNLPSGIPFLDKNPVPVILSWNHLPDGTWKDLLRQTALMIRPPLLIVSYQPIGRYLWSEVLSLGGYDVLVKPFGPSDVFRQITLAWEHWKERAS